MFDDIPEDFEDIYPCTNDYKGMECDGDVLQASEFIWACDSCGKIYKEKGKS